MPELPEVEAHRRRLQAWMASHRIVSVSAPKGRTFRFTSPALFRRHLKGRRVLRIDRRGKLLLLRLDGDVGVLAHLGMSGRFVRRSAQDPPPRFRRATFVLETQAAVDFVCPRHLGWLKSGPHEALVSHPAWSVLGPDPLEDPFDASVLAGALAGSRAPVKAVLMDQRRIAGLGNIQASEALWRAGIDPRRRAHTLSSEEVERLCCAIRTSLEATLTSLGADGEHPIAYLSSGEVENPFSVYGREGAPCPRCGAAIVRFVQGGRSTFACPTCQR